MSQTEPSPIWHEQYISGFIERAHQLLAWGHEDAKKNGLISSASDEPTITGYIVKAIEDRLCTLETDEYDSFAIHENKPDNKTGRVGKHRPMPDITIRRSARGFRGMEFTFEAKRLRWNDFPVRNYVGKEGLQCFIRGDYASDSEVAAMVAYLQSNTPEYWFNQLSKCPCIALTKVEVLPCLPHEWTSEHMRGNKRSITIYHIFLNCIEDC